MPIEQVLLIVPAAMLATGFMLWTRRTQRLASSSIIVTTSLAREQLEHLFFECIGRGGRDRCGVFDGHVASQPNHFRWTLALHFDLSHDEVGAPVMLADTRHVKAHFMPYPAKYPVWQVIERWEELGPRMRSFIKALRRADPSVDIKVVPAMFT